MDFQFSLDFKVEKYMSVNARNMVNIDECGNKNDNLGLRHDTGCLGLVHWDDPEGWNGEGGGRTVQD